MEPDRFRESRQAINRLCDNMNGFIEANDIEASRQCWEKAREQLDVLIPQADDEIQERSVKNLGLKIKSLLSQIDKIKVKKNSAASVEKSQGVPVEWDEDRIKKFSPAFLKKVSANMGKDSKACVCFDTTGKGIRPSYEIRFENTATASFNGSSHKLREKSLPGGKLSRPFSAMVIDSVLNIK